LRLAFVRSLNRLNRSVVNLAIGRGDLFHTSQHLHCLPSKIKLSATLFDMSCWTVPETHLPENVAATRDYAERVRLVDGIVAISNSAREDAIRLLRLPAAKIEVISPGVHDAYFNVDRLAVESVQCRYQLRAPYLLWVGTVEPRKNVDTLLVAYASLPRDIRHEWPLFLAGPPGWSSAPTLARMQSTAEGWRYLGYVPEGDLSAIMAGASIFVFPSLYEGFGLPLAQAMAAGTACITSSVSSLPEVAGHAAVLVEPRSPDDLARAMRRLILSPSERQELAKRGQSRARTYTWEHAARKSWRFFERIATTSS
jgi:alpha-1,3-rhamnosyl/mannosyltransferase